MAKTVNEAFNNFLNYEVNISKSQSDNAKNSRDFLKSQIHRLSSEGKFLKAVPSYDLNFGSFARKTKIQPLDDIDIMIGLNGFGLQIETDKWDNIRLKIKPDCTNKDFINLSDKFSGYWVADTYYLNSNKVKNKLITALNEIPQYEKAEIHGRGEAVTLKLLSYSWNFDIVPCFFCDTYYLIPNGYGNWKKTNPQIEQNRISKLNQKFNGVVLKVIRLIKYWNKHRRMPTMASYVLETMVLDYFEQTTSDSIEYVDIRFRKVLNYIGNNILYEVQDSKGIQGNINNSMTYSEKLKIQNVAREDYNKSVDAINAETQEKNHKKAISIWGDIFGERFPKYE